MANTMSQSLRCALQQLLQQRAPIAQQANLAAAMSCLAAPLLSTWHRRAGRASHRERRRAPRPRFVIDAALNSKGNALNALVRC